MTTAATSIANTYGITFTYNSSTGILTLSGANETDAHWQSILQGVTFNDSSATPTDPGGVTVTATNGGTHGSDTQDLHLDPPPVNLFEHQRTNADAFSSAAYNLNTGTDNWAGNWTESDAGVANSPTSGDIQIVSNELRFGDNNSNLVAAPKQSPAKPMPISHSQPQRP